VKKTEAIMEILAAYDLTQSFRGAQHACGAAGRDFEPVVHRRDE